jgi:hypothetical protein
MPRAGLVTLISAGVCVSVFSFFLSFLSFFCVFFSAAKPRANSFFIYNNFDAGRVMLNKMDARGDW